jgi:hypothetical protein
MYQVLDALKLGGLYIMAYIFKEAKRESVGLLIGLIGPSGSGKTFSAMRIAAGIVGAGNRFAVIDTENRRALHYADAFQFDHLELNPPFDSLKFAEAIEAADKAGYKAIVIDSCSHEWASEGGVLDFQEHELVRMAGDDYKKREACKMAAWIKPKGNHKQMVQRLLRTKAHLILCFRAEEKTKIEKDQTGKTHIIPMGFQPVCSKELPYELTVSFLLSSDHPGIGQPIKLQEQHKIIFPSGKLLSEESGKLAAEWAAGGVQPLQSTAPAQEVAPEGNLQSQTANSGQSLAPDEVIIKIKEVTSKSGETKGKPWTVFSIVSKNGDRYGTFDVKIAELAKDISGKDLMAKIQWEQAKQGKQIVSLQLAA